eukprot:m.50323 g.50323  ORF g.50323 m.50323 type:complete len:557 (-) comp7230_c0_seq1:86-1756(-)
MDDTGAVPLPEGYGMGMDVAADDAMAAPAGPAADEAPSMLCVDCGAVIPHNPTGMCVTCLRRTVDITETIPKSGVLYWCKGCERYLSPPATWVKADLESRELLALCLKRLKGLNKVKLVDAGFAWTEPHSKRIKVKVKIQKEIVSGAILQQEFLVEFVVHSQFCDDCHRMEAKDTWNAVVQLRQKVPHKKTFFYLEQLIMKHRAHRDCINIKSLKDGVDFFFSTRSHAKRLLDFLQGCSPCRLKTSERLISADIHTSTYNYKFTLSVELVPICKTDVVCLHPGLARKHGHISQLCICDHVGSTLRFIDPFTLKTAEITADAYWQKPFNSICTQKHLTEYMVLDVEPVDDGHHHKRGDRGDGKYQLAELTLARVKDFGNNDETCIVRTHLGHVLQPGDLAWGFDLATANLNDEHAEKLDPASLPEAIIIKKSYSERRKAKRRNRSWKLRELSKVEDESITKRDAEMAEADYEGFLQDLEEDKDLRSTINIYRDPVAVPESDAGDEDDLKVTLEEMLDEFDALDIAPASGGGGGRGPEDDVSELDDRSPKRTRPSPSP